MALPDLEMLWERARMSRLLPKEEDSLNKYLLDLRQSTDLQKDLYIRVLEKELGLAIEEATPVRRLIPNHEV